MKRSHRVALTAVTATAALAGAGTALALSPVAPTGAAAPVAGAVPVDQPVAVQAADALALRGAVSRLEHQVGSLEDDLRTALQQLDEAAATAAPARTRTMSAPARRPATRAPAVHIRTGAGAAAGAEHEGNDD